MRARLQKLDWPRILLELVIVTAGVLFALSLDEWMSSRKDRAEEELPLHSVRTELQAIITDMDREIVFRKAMRKNTQDIYALAETGAVDSILVGGKLRLVENDDYFTLRDWTVPYLVKHADFSQLLATMRSERPGSAEKGEFSFRYHPRVPRDHAELLNDTELDD